MGMLQSELEFEYLASRVGFLNGILAWLFAISLHLTIPEPAVGKVRATAIATVA